MSQDQEPRDNSPAPSLLPTEIDNLDAGGGGNPGSDHWIREAPSPWSGLTLWAAGVGIVALLLIATLAFRSSDGGRAAARAPAAAGDGVVTVRQAELGPCGAALRAEDVRSQVTLDVSEGGRVTRVHAAGLSASAKSCLEAHVASWDFLPQASAVSLTVDMAIAR